MDTITEDKMAIEMAKLGGLGIIHRYCSIEQQVEMVKKVKRYTNYIITNPYTVNEYETIFNVKHKMKEKNVKSLLINDEYNNLQGIITNRDILYFNSNYTNYDMPVKNVMTTLDKIILLNEKELENNNFGINQIIQLLSKNKIQKLPIIDDDNKIRGLITLKDMLQRSNNEFKLRANLDNNSQLCVGCAVGVNKDYLERTRAVIEAGCNIICIDIAHGHHLLTKQAIQNIREQFPNIEIIAGNVCSAEGVKYLAEAGANCIKVGIGPGSICITRKQTGCGVPQLSAVFECAKMAKQLGVTIIADGGHNRTIGNIFKALCAGSSASMLGGMLSGTTETPGQIYTKLNKKVKQIRGIAGILSNYNKSAKLGKDTKFLEQITPEGVEGYVPFKGPVKDILNQIEGGIRSGLSYVGCSSLNELNNSEIEFVLVTNNGFKESGSHNIKEI